MEQYLTLQEAAEQLAVTPSALRHAIRDGHLRSILRGGAHWTTREWIDAYRAHVLATRGGKGKKRGPRGAASGESQDAGAGEASEEPGAD